MGKFVFDFFVLLKTEKNHERLFQHFGHALKTKHQSLESFSNSFQTHKTLHREKRPNGASFKLFLDSLNMKIPLSTCLLNTRKII